MSREQIIRDTAYAIWEAEGKPDGRASQHWRQAEEHVAASLTSSKAPAKGTVPASAKTAQAEAKPPAKVAATKPAAAKPPAAKAVVGKAAKPTPTDRTH